MRIMCLSRHGPVDYVLVILNVQDRYEPMAKILTRSEGLRRSAAKDGSSSIYTKGSQLHDQLPDYDELFVADDEEYDD